jgi:hypothetical protein
MPEGNLPAQDMNLFGFGAEEPYPGHATKPVLTSLPLNSNFEEVSGAWRPCVTKYHVSPKLSRVRLHQTTRFKEFREPLAGVILRARKGIDRLYATVRFRARVVSRPGHPYP